MKLKRCSSCDKDCYLWKSKPPQCKMCAMVSKPIQPKKVSPTVYNKPVKGIKKVSDKRKKLDAAYSVLATQFKKDYPVCQASLHGCQGVTTDIHHIFCGASRQKYYLDTTEWLAVCRHCHDTIHNVLSKEDAIAMGFKKTY